MPVGNILLKNYRTRSSGSAVFIFSLAKVERAVSEFRDFGFSVLDPEFSEETAVRLLVPTENPWYKGSFARKKADLGMSGGTSDKTRSCCQNAHKTNAGTSDAGKHKTRTWR
ncbi:uncharacterized protein LOC122243664 isoform X5 [Penaeus japonicus]|uniref:uncharacterized protein LOC122243664 isoform X5 n=1 Tax=Penaeus japonicus TaxID=27405 RepID=UPI001C710575|nr:uncharacterized protein LOC122243664 isoform X5 [Penaeus japonicus]XP_042857235.1 uncharacterized protein LOC122243664 isoform X5 [Penaeus japonicus]